MKYEPNNPFESIKCQNKLKQRTVLQCFQSTEHLHQIQLPSHLKDWSMVSMYFFKILNNNQQKIYVHAL